MKENSNPGNDEEWSVLVACADPRDLTSLASDLRVEGCQVTAFSESVDLLEELINFACPMQPFPYSLMIIEAGLPSATCIEFMEVLGKHEDFPPILLIAEKNDQYAEALARHIEGVTIFRRPFKLEDLVAAAIGERSEKHENP